MPELAISVERLSKQYQLGAIGADTLRGDVARWFARWRGRPDPLQRVDGAPSSPRRPDRIWALKDVTFQVRPGEVVGVIGNNGAGKSTLLKIMSRITAPTSGVVRLRGRIGSLLEVGTGFHPELSGRENVFLNGAILGMRKAEIARKFDEIVAFSGVESHIDTPVKRYSSGMHVRLAFAVAAHLETEILLVDEVLAVGDAEFQKKCLGKMGEVTREGRSVLLVSHNMQAVSTIAERCILLRGGELAADGPRDQVIHDYLSAKALNELEYAREPSADAPRITSIRILTTAPGNIQHNRRPMSVVFRIATPRALAGSVVSFQVVDAVDRPIAHLWTFDSQLPMLRQPGIHELTCTIPDVRLYQGRYALKVNFHERSGSIPIEILNGVCPFEVVMYGQERDYVWESMACTYIESGSWEVVALDPGELATHHDLDTAAPIR